MTTAPPRVMLLDHQGKSLAIRDALAQAGCRIVDDPARAEVLLIDHDAPFHGRLAFVEACVANGGKALLYPHGAEPTLMARWDGLAPASPLLSGALVTAPGHAEVARRFGYAHPVYTVGWSLCPLRPRQHHGRVANVLFAPMHPPWECGWNAPMFERLLELPVHLTVRHLGSLEENGLWDAPGVDYVRGDITGFDAMIAQIDAADVVVAPKGTFMCLAVARGVATVTWRSTWAKNDELTHDAANLDRYRAYVRYPFDGDDAPLWDLVRAAAADEARVARWRARFIGEPLSAGALLAAFAKAPRRRPAPASAPPPVIPGVTRDPGALHRAALACVQDGHVELAHRLLTDAVANGVDVELLNDLAVVTNALGDGDRAEALLRACLAIDPDHLDAARNLAALAPSEHAEVTA